MVMQALFCEFQEHETVCRIDLSIVDASTYLLYLLHIYIGYFLLFCISDLHAATTAFGRV